MADEIKEYAGGWITERKGTDVPGFLKLAFVVIGLGAASYLIAFMNGEINHSDRGMLVRALNAATRAADGLMWTIFAIAILFVLIVVKFAVSRFHED